MPIAWSMPVQYSFEKKGTTWSSKQAFLPSAFRYSMYIYACMRLVNTIIPPSKKDHIAPSPPSPSPSLPLPPPPPPPHHHHLLLLLLLLLIIIILIIIIIIIIFFFFFFFFFFSLLLSRLILQYWPSTTIDFGKQHRRSQWAYYRACSRSVPSAFRYIVSYVISFILIS